MFEHAVRMLGTDVAKTVMIGDSRRSDHDGANDYGLRAVLLKKTPEHGITTARTASEAMHTLLGWD